MFRLQLFTTKYSRAKRRTATLVFCLGIATAASAEEWRLVELPATPLGWKNVTPRAINAAGQIVGEHHTEGSPAFSYEAFFFDGRSWIGLGTLGGDTSSAGGLNDRGEVVGRSDTVWTTDCYTWDGGSYCSPEIHAFVWRDGGLHDLGVQGAWSVAAGINDLGSIAGTTGSFAQQWAPDGTVDVFGTFGGTCRFSDAAAINARGQVVGYATTDSGSHAFLWDPHSGLRDLGTLGGPTSWATAISDAGHVVGQSDTATVTACVTNEWGTFCEHERHPFLWKDGEMIDLGTLGGPDGAARGVNSRGDVVGDSSTDELLSCWVEGGMRRCVYRYHAFVWSDGEMIDLGVPGAFSFATGINDRGDIVGYAGRPVLWQPD